MQDILPDDFDVKDFLGHAGLAKHPAKFAKNERIFVQGEAADTIFFIWRGQVKLSVVSQQGKDAVVAILNGGEFCGEGCRGSGPIKLD